MANLTPLFLVAVLLTIVLSERTFENHKVVRIPVQTMEALDYLADLFYHNNTLDFWTEPISLDRNVDIRVTPDQAPWLCAELGSRGIEHHCFIENVQELVEQQLSSRKNMKEAVGIDYTQYHTYDEIIAWIKTLPQTYPNIVSLVDIGTSYEGRQLLALKITSTKNSTTKPAVWFDGCIHAREWIATATVVYMLGHILSDYGTDSVVTGLVDNLEIYVLPVFNPDGYDYTWTNDRMWRKTRSPNKGTACVGTDPNRNWDYEWGGAGVSTDPCSEAYLGPAAFSEIEVKSVGEYIKNSGNFKGYINFHSYAQLWMSPWGYTSTLPKDYSIQNALSARCVSALKAVHGTSYGYGPIATTIYPASGSSADYTYGLTNTLFSYGVELRDTGRYGFLLPPNQIVPSGEETYEAIKVWAQAVMNA